MARSGSYTGLNQHTALRPFRQVVPDTEMEDMLLE